MILDKIVEQRKIQLEQEKSRLAPEIIKELAFSMKNTPADFYKALKKETLSVIAEVKKASPSKKVICEEFHPVEIATQYEKAGADAVSCLTEEFYFQGSREYLNAITRNIQIPVLKKDFIIDEYQIYDARITGASAVLLISAVLDTETMNKFYDIAKSLGLECLFEAHNEQELESIMKCDARIIGVNNRNLKTFEVSLDNSANLMKLIPGSCVKISESGIATNEDMKKVRSAGADAVLIGETLVKSNDIKGTMKTLRAGV